MSQGPSMSREIRVNVSSLLLQTIDFDGEQGFMLRSDGLYRD